ncbi:hypothetical protein TNCT_476371 [Trichonephila clavata]|uniref:Uncharacterized protein n=1 Tax=Trichonephila clavata TaxID=2740835 RepID=A0A8X6L0T7_TRICU|nr:hypothetical protein TNCT_476371 [Trichonephila clavata]
MSQPNSDETKTSPSPIASRTRGIVREMESKTTSCCCLLCGYYVKDIHMLMPHVLQHPASARRRKVEHQLTKALEAANREAMNSSIPSAEVLVATDPTPPLHQTPEEIHSPISSPNSGNEASQVKLGHHGSAQSTRLHQRNTGLRTSPRQDMSQRP